MIHIDGSQGEGGGQVLRSSLALAAATGQAVTLTGIRAGRPKPGLMRQHLTCVAAAQAICAAQVEGARPGSTALRFEPGTLRGGDHHFAVGTAGSAMLVLQTVWPALLLAAEPSRLLLQGGTHNPLAPCFHFIDQAYAPLMLRLAGHAGAPEAGAGAGTGTGSALRLLRCGFAPAGGGEVEVALAPAAALQPFDLLERGAPLDAWADCLAPGLRPGIAARELNVLRDRLGWEREQLRIARIDASQGPGNALLATLRHEQVTEVFCAIGDKGRSAERVGADVAVQVGRYQLTDAALGPHLADQWVLPLALAVWRSGRPATFSCSEVSSHALTNFRVIERFLPVAIRHRPRPAGGGWHVEVRTQGG